MMDRSEPGETFVRVAAALAIALVFSPMIRTITSELDNSVGRVWPFTLNHCHVRATPGCDLDTGGPAAATPARADLRASR
jgi:hypothetical protein